MLGEHPTDVISSFDVIGNQVFASYMHDAASRLERFESQRQELGALELATIGTAKG